MFEADEGIHEQTQCQEHTCYTFKNNNMMYSINRIFRYRFIFYRGFHRMIFKLTDNQLCQIYQHILHLQYKLIYQYMWQSGKTHQLSLWLNSEKRINMKKNTFLTKIEFSASNILGRFYSFSQYTGQNRLFWHFHPV